MKLRRILAILLAAALLLGMMPAALADAPAPKPSTADYCSQSSNGKHQMQWTVVEPPTCTQKGLQTGVCALCRYATRQDVPPTGHNFTGGGYEWIREPTCTEEGLKQVWCANRGCKETRQETVPALGHDWGDWKTTKEATCTETGSRRRACSRCGETQDETVSALGHKYTSSVVLREPTCAMVGERQAKCERCGKTVSEAIPTVPHTFTEDWAVALEAGDWSAGVKSRKCAVCGQAERQPFYKEGTILPEDRGDAMKGLQEALNEHGFDCGTADGIYGPKTQAAIEAAEETAGHEATGIGWTGLQKWLADGAVPAPDDDDTDYGWTPPATMGNIYDAGSKLTEARDKPPKNEEDPLRIILQPEGGLLAHDHPANTVPAITLRVRAAGGVTPYAYEWHYEPKMPHDLLAAKLDQMGSALTESYNRIKASLGTAQSTAYPVAGASGGRTLADFSRVVGDNTGACVVSSVGMYYCVITDAAGETVTSDTVEVGYKLFISQQPQNANIRGKESVSFSCVAAGGDGSPYEYEWHLPDGSVRKTSDGELKDVSATGEYYCVVTCGGENATSSRVKLYDNDPLQVTCKQDEYYISNGKPAQISMTVTGGIPPYKCKWLTGEPGHAYTIQEYTADIAINNAWIPNPYEVSEPGIYWFTVTDGSDDWQWDASTVIDETTLPLEIAVQPTDVVLEGKDDWKTANVYMKNGEGTMKYYLYEEGKSGAGYYKYGYRTAGDAGRLHGSLIVKDTGKYYFHIVDGLGRSIDSDIITVTRTNAAESRSEPLRIAVQPQDVVLGANGSQYAYITMANGAGHMQYYLYKKGDSGTSSHDFDAKNADAPDRLTGKLIVKDPGEYYIHVADSFGRTVDSNTFKVTKEGRQLKIVQQPVSGELPKDDGYKVSITMAEGDGAISYALYRKGESTPINSVYWKNGNDRLTCYCFVWEPGEYYYHVEDWAGNWADSDTITVTNSFFRVYIDKTGGTDKGATADSPVTLTARTENGAEPITYEWELKEKTYSSGTSFYSSSTTVSKDQSITVVRPGGYQCIATDKNGQTDECIIDVEYAGTRPIIVQQPTVMTGARWEWDEISAKSSYNTDTGISCRAVLYGDIDYITVDSLAYSLKYEWEVKKPSTCGWSAAGEGYFIPVDINSGNTYRCRVTNTRTGDYVYTNEAEVSGITVTVFRETMMSDNEHAHIRIEFQGGTGPYRVELRGYNAGWGGRDWQVQTPQTVIAYSGSGSIPCDFWSLTPSFPVQNELTGEWESFDYYYVITDAAGHSVTNRPW